jgi:hypothetical protein
MRVESSAKLAPADGNADWQQRRCVVHVEP